MLTKTMLSAGENYLFSVMHNINTSAANLNKITWPVSGDFYS